MAQTNLDVVGIGNALVDVIAPCDDGFVAEHGVAKGSMTLVDTAHAEALYRAMGPGVEMSGGSAANTMTGIASFGGRAGYVGKIAADQLGEVFAHDLRAVGVAFASPPASVGVPTGRSLILVTPDAQRTMHTYLGVAELLGPGDIDEAFVASGRVTYLEGYLWDRPEAMEAYRKAAAITHAAGGQVALTLSDSFCVQRHRQAFLDLVADEVDILFANEAEITTLFDVDDFDHAMVEARRVCEIAVLTRSAQGSVVAVDGEVVTVAAAPVERVADTTGAGDLYAAGFLFGLTQGYDLATCGRLASMAAAEVITHVGARPLTSLARLAERHLP